MNRPLINIAQRKVIRGSQSVVFGRIEFAIFAAFYFNGTLSLAECFDIVYGHRYDGGPLYGPKVIDVKAHQMKKKMKQVGLDIRRVRHNLRELVDVSRQDP